MLSEELVKKIRQVQIVSSRMVSASFAGQYESVFKGRGMQFDEVREYMPGDDIRAIDWNVTARAGKPFIKRYIEEREMTVMLLVDLSASGDFATAGRLKNELAAEFCAVLAFAAIRSNDKVGLIIFTDRIEHFIPPAKGTAHVLRLIRELLCFKTAQRKTDIPLALDYLCRVIRKTATIFLVSDFFADDFTRTLSLVNRRHDLVTVTVQDPAELSLPRAGLIELRDAETGHVRMVDSSSSAFQKAYQLRSEQRALRLTQTFRSMNVDNIVIQTDKPYINDLVKYFHQRHRRA